MFTPRPEDKPEYFKKEIYWVVGNNATCPYVAKINKDVWEVRVNDFPEKNMYSLLVNGREIEDFNKWPENWHKPEKINNIRAKL